MLKARELHRKLEGFDLTNTFVPLFSIKFPTASFSKGTFSERNTSFSNQLKSPW